MVLQDPDTSYRHGLGGANSTGKVDQSGHKWTKVDQSGQRWTALIFTLVGGSW